MIMHTGFLNIFPNTIREYKTKYTLGCLTRLYITEWKKTYQYILFRYNYLQIDECFKECITKCGDSYKATMCFGNTKHSMTYKLDQEGDFEGNRFNRIT